MAKKKELRKAQAHGAYSPEDEAPALFKRIGAQLLRFRSRFQSLPNLGCAELLEDLCMSGAAPLNQSVFQDAAWHRAATLVERISRKCAQGRPRQNDEEEAGRRMLRWRSQPPFTNASIFAQRLAMDGLSEDEFVRLLGEPLDSLRACFPTPPSWLTELAVAFTDNSPKLTVVSEPLRDQPAIGLLNSIEPLIALSLARLHKRLRQAARRARPKAPWDPDTIERIFLPDLLRQLSAMVGRTMVLELNVARLEGLLDGDTPEDRFRSFLQRVRQPEIGLAIMHEYPVLARQLTTRLDQWVAFTLEFLEHLCADWDFIRHAFSPEKEPGVLVHAQADAGDRHRSGRSVVIAKFSSGFQLVYKPKSMAADVHFQELLNWTNQRGNHPSFRTLQILDRGTYGWAEFVAAETCDPLPALRRFYERQGGYLALLYMLQATDFHCDNLIAAGEHPVLIDLEAIFQPTLPQAPEDLDETEMAHSVLGVGLLPWRDWQNAESEGIDISGLGGAAGQITPHGVPDWEKAGTDEMRLTRKRMAVRGAHNRPTLNGVEVNPCDYVNEITAGFAGVYRLLVQHREDLLSPEGPLSRFAHDDVRVILRGTRSYGVLLAESFHPDVLRDALDRDLLFDRLWVAVESRPWLAKVVFAEREDLQRGDIPLFTARPGCRNIWSSPNRCVRDFFDEPALALVRRRLLQFSERELDLQLWMIQASLATTAVGHADSKRRPPYRLSGSQGAVDHDQLLRAARTLGDRLESVAIRANGAASWVGLTLADECHWSISPLAADLYDGLPGVALFLAYLGAQTGERRYTNLAREACATMLRRSEECKSSVRSIGGFDGWGGMIYTLTHLGGLWHDPELLGRAAGLVAMLPALIEEDEQFDIVAGAAGCIGSLIALYHQAPSQHTLAAAVQCGDHLIARARQTENGSGWVIPHEVKPLSGFAHGAAGIAWALLKLAALSKLDRFRTTALAAIAYERSLFSPQAGNWRDLRVGETTASELKGSGDFFMTAWCNGAPGIGLARLSTIQQLGDHEVHREIETALNTTLNHGFGGNHSLCHGDLGNLELPLQAGQVFKDLRWHAEVYRVASHIVESVARNEYLCGTPLSIDSPGLMTGLAGIGYGLLRLAEPACVPCVLTLEPPLQD